jgi:DNA repair exonuclease SbcCD ATPase subunit
MDFDQLRKKLNRLSVELAGDRKQLKKELKEAEIVKENIDCLREAQSLIQECASVVQQKAHAQISKIVTYCLVAVFGQDESYQFEIEFKKKRGKTEAELHFIRNGKRFHPTAGAGGGVVEVAAFALRVAAIMLTKPKKRRLLILDEPFKMVSSDYVGRIASMLEAMADELEFQFIIVTHNDELKVGNVVEIH